jgi:hypothetical protein
MNYELLKPEGSSVSSSRLKTIGIKLVRDMNPCKEVMLSPQEQLANEQMIQEWISKPKNFIKDYGTSTDKYIKKGKL